MQTITSGKVVSELTQIARSSGQKVGFVPTMGALHQGHKSLVEKARNENDLVVVSIFVNPTQFNDAGDLKKYPRTPDQDADLLLNAGCDILFVPSVDEMYPAGFDEEEKTDLVGLDLVMEGRSRPGHFNGVVQVVKKLFSIVGECNSYFGEKDFQQLAIIRRMTKQLYLPVKIIACPTVRESGGLAMSSRNMRLSPEGRMAANNISKILFALKAKWKEMSTGEAKRFVEEAILAEKLFRLDYFDIVDRESLLPSAANEKRNVIGCIAVFIGEVRLIDNVSLD
ncbi:MAG: pantoate--beta-alanine ligase [Bacteroidetes bacterium]|nr:pantoate--beta-alanine ligase [Bacteroidota bacterium]